MEEGLFPHKLSLDDDAGIEEERRLCYVGMTRARDRLVLSWARQRRMYGRDSLEGSRRSRFLDEVPANLLEPLSAQASKARTTWENAVNSIAGAERFLRERGIDRRLGKGRGGSRAAIPALEAGQQSAACEIRHRHGSGM